jgi:hypothetical protein
VEDNSGQQKVRITSNGVWEAKEHRALHHIVLWTVLFDLDCYQQSSSAQPEGEVWGDWVLML